MTLKKLIQQIDDWDSKIVKKYRDKSCPVCGLEKDGLKKMVEEAYQAGRESVVDTIENMDALNEGEDSVGKWKAIYLKDIKQKLEGEGD